MKNQLNLNENSSVLLGAIMGVTPGQAKIVSDLPPEAQQPAIDMCQIAAQTEASLPFLSDSKRTPALKQEISGIYLGAIWLHAHEIVEKKLANAK